MQWETATPVGFPLYMRHKDCRLKKPADGHEVGMNISVARLFLTGTTLCLFGLPQVAASWIGVFLHFVCNKTSHGRISKGGVARGAFLA